MKFFFTFLFICVAVSCEAQVIELGYGPVSNAGLGSLPETSKTDLSVLFEAYKSHSFHYLPGIRYSYVHSKCTTLVDKSNKKINGRFNMLFFLPASFNVPLGRFAYINRIGLGLSDKYFPNDDGMTMNFVIEFGFGYAITPHISASIRYSHISNGYRGTINPGVDNATIALGYYF
jgi:hypothetical protein